MRRILLLLPLVLGACAAERAMQTNFRPTAGGFEFDAQAIPAYAHDLPSGEAMRMQWLEDLLAMNGMCPGGYRITDRQVVAVHGDSIHRVFYEGACV